MTTKSRNELRKLFSFVGAAGQIRTMYKDDSTNEFYVDNYGMPCCKIDSELAKSYAWFHINRNQKATPTSVQVSIYLS